MRNKLILIIGLLFIGLMVTTSTASTMIVEGDDLAPDINVEISATSDKSLNNSIWILPGPRSIDPDVFGTPDQPLKLNWLPKAARNTTDDNRTYTTTTIPTPFSNKTMFLGGGSVWINTTDKSPIDSPDSMDMATAKINFTDPTASNKYYIMLKKSLPVGPDHPFFGGVGTNVLMHGTTEIGNPMMPTVFAYMTLWGAGDLYVNNTLASQNTNRVVHIMLTQRVRTDNFELGFDVHDPNQMELHIVLPPTRIADGNPIDSPVMTNYTLPNGEDQPFLHFNFYDLEAVRRSSERAQTTTTIIESTLPTVTITPQAQDPAGTKTFGFTSIMVFISLLAVIPILRKYKNK